MAFAESDTIVIPKEFDRNGLYDICKQLETIFLENSDTVAKITNLLNSYGIKFFLFDNEKGTHIDGFSFMRNGTPNIVLTLRHKKIDILAFTLLHELYHTFVHLTGNEDNNMISLADYKESYEENPNIKIFVDTPDDIRFIRRLERDIKERGRTVTSVINQYLTSVRPMHHAFVEPSKQYADIIVPIGGENTVAVDIITNQIISLLK